MTRKCRNGFYTNTPNVSTKFVKYTSICNDYGIYIEPSTTVDPIYKIDELKLCGNAVENLSIQTSLGGVIQNIAIFNDYLIFDDDPNGSVFQPFQTNEPDYVSNCDFNIDYCVV